MANYEPRSGQSTEVAPLALKLLERIIYRPEHSNAPEVALSYSGDVL